MLRFSANLSLLFTEYPWPQRFAAARAAGFDAVEIQFPYDLEIATLKTLLADNDLKLVLINLPAGDLMAGGDGLACVPDRMREFHAAVGTAARYAEALSVPAVNILAGRQPRGLTHEQCMDVLAGNCAHALATFREIGVTVVTEAINTFDMPGFLVHSLAHMQQLCDRIAGLKMQFDCYHMHRTGTDVATALRDHIATTGHIQFADVPGRHEPGTGRMDYATLFALLEELPYTGWCGAEYRPSGRSEDSLAWLHRLPHNATGARG